MKCYHIGDFAPDPEACFHVTRDYTAHNYTENVHCHDFLEVVYFASAVGCMIIDDAPYPILPGDIYILPRGSIHSFYIVKNLVYHNLLIDWKGFSEWEMKMFREHGNFSELFLFEGERRSRNCYHFPAPQTENLKQFFDAASQLARKGAPGYGVVVKAYTILIINEICRLHSTLPSLRSPSMTTAQMLSDSVDFMLKNYRGKITLAEMAGRNRVTANHFCRFFREKTGMPFVAYLNSIRIAAACRDLLSRPEAGIAEIAAECGFSDPVYFSRIFGRLVRTSPTEFRRNKGNIG